MATIKKVLAVVLSLCMMLPLTLVSSAADEYTLTPIADILALTENSTEEFYVKGEVTEVQNTMYGNIVIKDEAGDEILLYGLYDSTGTTRYDKLTDKPVNGDTVVVCGPLVIYNGTYELKNVKLISLEKGDYVVPDPVEATIPEINAMTADSGLQEYIVEGVITSVTNATYGNIYIQDANGNELYIYGLYDSTASIRYDAMTEKPDEGDTIKVIGPVTIYSGVAQLKNAKLQSFVAGDLPEVEEPEEPDVPVVEGNKVVFELGDNGDAAHVDGNDFGASKSFESGSYTLDLVSMSKVYGPAFDAMGNSCIKLGTSKVGGSFSFTVPDAVTNVIIAVSGYKASKVTVTVNGEATQITTTSNSGEYTELVVDTSTNKTIAFASTTSFRAMINSITYVIGSTGGDSECDHEYAESERQNATCTEDGYIVYDCEICGATYEDAIKATGHDMVAGEVVAPTLETEGYTIYTCSVCGATENRDFTPVLLPEGTTEVKFELGTDVAAGTHKDNSSAATTYSETVGEYTLSITDGVKMYPKSNDAAGKTGIKLGTGSAKGGFVFTVPAEVKSVIIEVAQYKAYATTVNINGTEYVITTSSNNGDYTEIEVDTSSVKTVEFNTVTYRAMVGSITYVIVAGSCEHDYVAEETTAPTCTETGVITNTCSLCGDSYTEDAPAKGHTYVAGDVVAPGEFEAGYTVYDCDVCGATMNSDFVSPVGPTAPEGIEEIVFEFGDNGDALHDDGDALTAPVDYTSGDYTLTFTALTTVYGGAFDAKGNSALKLGTGKATAALEFTVPENVNSVIIRIAGYKANNIEFTLNGETYTVELKSNDGTYYPIVIDTTETKTISLATTATIDKRALIDSITYWVSTACEHEYDNACDTDCNLCGEVRETSHSYDAGVVTAPTATEQGYTTYTCVNCGDSYKDNFVPATGEAANAYNVVATPSDTGIVVTWDAVEGADKYNFYLKNSAGETLVTRSLAADKTSITLAWPTDIEWGETYQIGIRPHTTKWLDTVYVTSALELGDRIVDIKTESVGRTIKVTWQAYEGATQYYVYVYEKGAYPTSFSALKAETNEVTIINAIYAEVDYEVRVVATKGVPKMLTANAIPVAARLNVFSPDVFIERGITPNSVAVAWDQIRGVDKVWVYLSRADGTGTEIIREAKGSYVGVYNLTVNTEYTVAIQARIVDADGIAHYSGKSAVLGTIKTSDWEDIQFKAVGTDAGAELSWNAHTNAITYYLYRSTNGGKTFKKIATISDGSTSYVDAAAKNGYQYAIQVQVKDDLVASKGAIIKSEAIVK